MIILGPKTQQYCEVFLQHCSEKDGNLVILSNELRNVFRDCKLYPTPTQILNIIHQSTKSNSPKNSITFGHFCAAMYEFETRLSLVKQHDTNLPSPPIELQPKRKSFIKSSQTMVFNKTRSKERSYKPSSFDDQHCLSDNDDLCNNCHQPSSCHSSPLSSTMDIVYNKLNVQCAASVTANSLQNILLKPHEVFLGGACNPTTWRWEVAIPYLKHNFTTYFNPQKDNWSPEMIENEEIAKRSAKLLLFVLDCRETRGIVSMVEVCYLAGCRKPLLVVLVGEKYSTSTQIGGNFLTPEEVDDLNRGLFLLNTFLDKMRVPVFAEMKSALQACSYLLKYNKTPSCLNSYSHIPDLIIGECLGEMRRCFNELDIKCRGFLSFDECCLALKLLFGLQSQFPSNFYQILKSNFLHRNEDEQPNTDTELDVKISLDDFSALAVEFSEYLLSSFSLNGTTDVNGRKKKNSGQGVFRSQGSTYYEWISSGFSLSSPAKGENQRERKTNILQSSPFSNPTATLKKDVFLGGSCGNLDWREQIVIPFLLENGITFYNPKSDPWDCSMFVKEELQKNVCTVLFYYIAASTRSVASMCEAAFYIGQGVQSIILCIEPITDAQIKAAGAGSNGFDCWKDYKRGRSYLTDMANQLHIPVYSRIQVALNSLLDKVKGTWV